MALKTDYESLYSERQHITTVSQTDQANAIPFLIRLVISHQMKKSLSIKVYPCNFLIPVES